MPDDIRLWLGLSLVPGVGSTLFKRLLERFRSPEAVFRASFKELSTVEGLSEKVARAIAGGDFEKSAERELYLLEKTGGRILRSCDPEYPRRLKEIYDPPPVLYVRGEIKKPDELAIAIVGSRKTSPYGRDVTENISRDLVRYGVTIVSGMARGIDTVAHEAAVSAGGRTIAVFGCGVDVVYPPENRRLCEEIIGHGAVISEFPMTSRPEAGHFPKRNRIISGLSMGVVVVQAGRKSGSLITAGYALEQSRDVYAVPGNVGAGSSQGTNQLIKEGAKLVEASGDILEEILPQWQKEQALSLRESVQNGPELSEEEAAVCGILGDSPLHIDAIIREARFDPGKISSILLNLELKGLVVQWPGKCFTKKT
jgi:DNA processing protein